MEDQAPYILNPEGENDYRPPHRHAWHLVVSYRDDMFVDVLASCNGCRDMLDETEIEAILNQHAQETA